MSAFRKYTVCFTISMSVALLALGACKKNDDETGAGGSDSTSSSSSQGGSNAGGRCDTLCQDLSDINCANSPSYDGCMLTCLALTSSSTCEPSADRYFDCTESVNVACSGAGDPFHAGCGPDYLVAIGCAVTQSPNPAMEQPCDAYCDNVVGASCVNGNTKEDCYTNCLWLGASGTGCDGDWMDYLDCANAANWTCVLDYPAPQMCGAPFTAYYACLDATG